MVLEYESQHLAHKWPECRSIYQHHGSYGSLKKEQTKRVDPCWSNHMTWSQANPRHVPGFVHWSVRRNRCWNAFWLPSRANRRIRRTAPIRVWWEIFPHGKSTVKTMPSTTHEGSEDVPSGKLTKLVKMVIFCWFIHLTLWFPIFNVGKAMS